MLTPEQIVADWIGVPYNPNWTEVQELVAAIQSYGAACAAAERERCMDVVKATAHNMRTDIDLRWQHGYRAACADLYNALRYEALPYVD